MKTKNQIDKTLAGLDIVSQSLNKLPVSPIATIREYSCYGLYGGLLFQQVGEMLPGVKKSNFDQNFLVNLTYIRNLAGILLICRLLIQFRNIFNLLKNKNDKKRNQLNLNLKLSCAILDTSLAIPAYVLYLTLRTSPVMFALFAIIDCIEIFRSSFKLAQSIKNYIDASPEKRAEMSDELQSKIIDKSIKLAFALAFLTITLIWCFAPGAGLLILGGGLGVAIASFCYDHYRKNQKQKQASKKIANEIELSEMNVNRQTEKTSSTIPSKRKSQMLGWLYGAQKPPVNNEIELTPIKAPLQFQIA